MSIQSDHELMKNAFLESKDIINEIFDAMKAPESWQIKHMTFDELVAALYKILGLWNGTMREPSTVTSQNLLKDILAYTNTMDKVIGEVEPLDETVYLPNTENIIIEKTKFILGNQIILGDPNLKPENIKPGVTIFEVAGNMPALEIDELLTVNKTETIIPEGYSDGTGRVRIELQEKTGMPSSSDVIVEPDEPNVLSKVTIQGDPNLKPENIKPGVEIFGIEGNMPSKTGDIKLTKVKPEDTSDPGYYEHEIKAQITDFDVVYVTNVEGEYAFVETISHEQTSFKITSSTPSKDGVIFKGWSLSPNGSGTLYTAGQTVNISGFAKKADTIVFYAAFKENQAPNPLTIQVSYKNNQQLSSDGTETAIVTLLGGDDPEGGSVTKSLQVDNCFDKTALTDNSWNVKFNKTGYYMAIGTSTDMFGAKSVATQLIQIKGAGGSSSGSGQFIDGKFDSGWIPENPINGCYVSEEDYHLKIPSGHSNGSNTDTMYVIGRKTDGTEIILWDNFKSSNTDQPADTQPGGGNLLSQQWNQARNLAKSLGIRQVKFLASSPHKNCVPDSTITFNVSLVYDQDFDTNVGGESPHTHTYGAYTQILAPTCVAAGKEECMCTGCRGKKYRSIAPLGHRTDGGKITKNPTCTSSGTNTETCTVCKTIINTKTIAALGHSWDNGVVTKEATATSTGIKTYTCKTCKSTMTETIPKLESSNPIEDESTETLDDPVLDENYRWGIYEIKHDSSLNETKKQAYISAYRRIYWGAKKNHLLQNGYYIINFSTKQKQRVDSGFFITNNVKFSNGTVSLPYTIKIRVDDLGLTSNELSYIKGIVYADCPEILMRWRWSTNNSSSYWSTNSQGNIYEFCFPGWEQTDLLNKQNQIKTLLTAINNKIKEKLNYTFAGYNENLTNGFEKKVKTYTDSVKKNIAKIIYDYLVLANEYGDANSTEGYNQILWPAMSYQSSTNKNTYKPVCASYAHAFKYCCWEWGIDALWVPGQGGPQNSRDALHAWNMVNYRSKGPNDSLYHSPDAWQEVDITWGDCGGYFDNAISYVYLNITQQELHNQNHHYKAFYGTTNYGVEKYKTFPANGFTICNVNKYRDNIIFGLF